MISLYYSLVYPYLDYANLAWGSTYASHLDPLFKLQKRAVRVINNVSYLSHTNGLFKSCSILKLKDIYNLQLGVHMYKNRCNSNFQRSHGYNTRGCQTLVPNFSRLTLTKHAISSNGPAFWNSLPEEIRNSNSVTTFKRNLRTFLIDKYVGD